MKRNLRFAVAALLAAVAWLPGGMQAQSWTGETAAAGTFYLYNVGAKQFLCAGNGWGSQASFNDTGIDVTLAVSGTGYSIDTKISNGGTNNFLTTGGYCDGASIAWTFASNSDGTYQISNGKVILGYDGSTSVVSLGASTGTDNAKWKLVTKASRLSALNTALAAATATSGVDATFFISCPDFGRNDTRVTSWNTMTGTGGNNTNNNGEKYNTTFDVYQTLSSVPNGVYTLTCQGFYRDGGYADAATLHTKGTEALNALLYANTVTTPLVSIFDAAGKLSASDKDIVSSTLGTIPNTQTGASAFLDAGYYAGNSVKVVVSNNTLKVGVKKTVAVSTDWTIFDKFRLTYYGVDLDAIKTQITDQITVAQGLTGKMSPAASTGLTTAIAAYNSATTYTEAELNTILTDLNTAITAAKASIAKYTTLKTTIDDVTAKGATVTGAPDAAKTTFDTAVSDANTAYTAASYTDEQATAEISTLTTALDTYVKAQTANGSDFTLAIVNPSFETGALDPWAAATATGADTGVRANSNDTYAISNAAGDYVFNTWGTMTAFDVTQSLTGLPTGYYILKALAASDYGNTVTLKAGTSTAVIKPLVKTTGYYGTTLPVNVTDGKLTISATSTTWFKVDNFTLKYYADELSAYQACLTDRVAEATTTKGDALEANVTGAELTDLNTAITNSSTVPTTVADCTSQLTTLQTAYESFVSAKPTYDAWVAQLTSFPAANYTATQYPYASATKLAAVVTAAAAVTSTTTTTEVATATTAYLKALREAVESNGLAECYSWTTNYTTSIKDPVNPTATTNWSDGGTSGLRTTNGQPYTLADGTTATRYYDTNKWGSAWTLSSTQTLSNMPVGTYLFSVMSRCSTNLTSYQLSGNGTKADMQRKGNSGELFGNGWNDNNVKFTQTTAGDMTLAVTGEAPASSWASFSNMRLVRISKDISDASDFSNAKEYTADVVLNRSLKASVWNTICLPFEVSSANLETIFGTGAKVAKFSGVTVTDEGNTKINFTTTDNSIAANQPCLINVPTAGNAWLIQGATVGKGTPSTVSNTGSNTTANLSVTVDMRGNYASLTDVKAAATTAAGSSALPYIVSNGNLYLVDVSTMILKPFRAYFTVSSTTGGSVKGLDITIDGETTDIEGINMNEQAVSGNVYNLKGQMVRKNASTMEGLQKGVYIVNGKKQIVK